MSQINKVSRKKVFAKPEENPSLNVIFNPFHYRFNSSTFNREIIVILINNDPKVNVYLNRIKREKEF